MSDQPEARKTDWRSIYVASFLAFCSAVQFSIYFTSIWPYLETIDPDVTEEFFGFCVAAYSIAQCIASPLFGYWSNKIKQVRLPMDIGIAAMFIGNLIYLGCELLPSHRRYGIFIGRFLTGIGAANVSLLRAYSSTACIPKDRPRAMSFVTGGISLGTMVGPAIQLVFTPISYPGLVIFPNFSISMYTASAYAACLMNAVCLFCLHCHFEEKYAGILNENVKSDIGENDEGATEKVVIPKFDRLGAFICNWTKFSQQFVFTNMEIIGPPIAMTVFAFTNQETVQIGSIAQSSVGSIALLVFLAFIGFKLNRYVKYRIVMIISVMLLLVFLLLTFPWPFISARISTYSSQDMLNATEELVGCNGDRLSWCHTTPRTNSWLYYIAFVTMIGLSYPMLDISLNTLYGRILGPRRQGTMQGILQVSSGVARIVGPISISVIYASYGLTLIWITQIVVVVITLLLWGLFYKRMVALTVPPVETKNSVNVVFPVVPPKQ